MREGEGKRGSWSWTIFNRIDVCAPINSFTFGLATIWYSIWSHAIESQKVKLKRQLSHTSASARASGNGSGSGHRSWKLEAQWQRRWPLLTNQLSIRWMANGKFSCKCSWWPRAKRETRYDLDTVWHGLPLSKRLDRLLNLHLVGYMDSTLKLVVVFSRKLELVVCTIA